MCCSYLVLTLHQSVDGSLARLPVDHHSPDLKRRERETRTKRLSELLSSTLTVKPVIFHFATERQYVCVGRPCSYANAKNPLRAFSTCWPYNPLPTEKTRSVSQQVATNRRRPPCNDNNFNANKLLPGNIVAKITGKPNNKSEIPSGMFS